MIKLFRHIRKSLIEQNKMGQYFRYAIGEIFLVMIGILLALQVNNWNQKRLNRLSERSILNDLKVEFEANYKDLNRVTKQHRTVVSEFEEIQRITASKQYDVDVLDSLMLAPTKWFTFTRRKGASDNLISAGKLDLISNKRLRDLINQWSGVVDDVVDDELFGIEFSRNTILPFMAKHYPAANMEYVHHRLFQSRLESSNLDATPILSPQTVDWSQLLDNMEFQSLISLRKTYEMHSITELHVAIESCLEIIDLIKTELNS